MDVLIVKQHCRNWHTVSFWYCRFYGNTASWPLVNCRANLIQSNITRIRVAQPSWSLYHNYRWIPPLWPEHKSLLQFSSVYVENADQSKVIFPQNQTFVIISIIINNEVNFFCIQRYFDVRWSFHIYINFLKMQYQRR